MALPPLRDGADGHSEESGREPRCGHRPQSQAQNAQASGQNCMRPPGRIFACFGDFEPGEDSRCPFGSPPCGCFAWTALWLAWQRDQQALAAAQARVQAALAAVQDAEQRVEQARLAAVTRPPTRAGERCLEIAKLRTGLRAAASNLPSRNPYKSGFLSPCGAQGRHGLLGGCGSCGTQGCQETARRCHRLRRLHQGAAFGAITRLVARCVARFGYRACRLGEAQHPGPSQARLPPRAPPASWTLSQQPRGARRLGPSARNARCALRLTTCAS